MDMASCEITPRENYLKYIELSGFSAFSFILGVIIARCCLKRISIN